ncbi:MmcQ/YjbR family DNA-binding protein [Streptomyces caniscabiei]|uniref:MmcQ/YjbR family DNA-binding protein n=1 Tax=Streptomyces caniscabiei TaxID=2746961 RepID=UPI0029B2BB90|nr:MmcQ/YjbR family DNA-binding protein [Streptomyces caniscabiei]MDX2598721.1 MmcQ/YjbR family DNA-binding protein [Streptomyces caniscabiei]MDX2736183.1 MmcQ/YjbR family DNA-binding protein [Streptomyces caniscabiei]MDX2778630.1 MmcQ/YjbR family DNA-binding protein [Streptomyces caniscabiei]
MTPQELRAFCLSFNEAVEDFPFRPEISVFKVLGKMFALSWIDQRPLKVNLKCDPEDAVRLRTEHPGLIAPGYHMNKRHWNTVTLDAGLPDRLVEELIEDSYDLVVAGLPRAERLRLDRG